MFLCKRITDYRQLVAVGQLTLVIGILFNNFDRFGWVTMSDFVKGFCHGFGLTILIVSAVFNLWGMVMYRRGGGIKKNL